MDGEQGGAAKYFADSIVSVGLQCLKCWQTSVLELWWTVLSLPKLLSGQKFNSLLCFF